MIKFVLLLLYALNLNIDPQLTYEKNARDFGFHGLHIGDSFTDATALFPFMVPVPELELSKGMNVFVQEDPGSEITSALFGFFKAKLYRINVYYDPPTLDEFHKGPQKMLLYMLRAFGTADSSIIKSESEKTYIYYFENVNRLVTLALDNNGLTVDVRDLQINRLLEELSQKKS